jgi:hypothetical protein
MLYFAVIENDKVTNRIIADSLEIAESVTGKTCIEFTDIHTGNIGDTYDGTNFISPTIEENN